MEFSDAARLASWYDAYGPTLVLYARQWLTREAAEDAVQQVFVHLASREVEPGDVKAWLYRSVRNAAISTLRRSRSRQRQVDQWAADRAPWFLPHPDELVDAGAAQDCLSRLPEEQRQVIVLRIWGGLTFREIADVLADPLPTCFARYRAGLAALRKRLESSCRTNPKT